MTSISNINSDIVTEMQNTPGVMTPILEISPEDGTTLVIENFVQRGDQTRGVPVFAEFFDSNGDPLPKGTEVKITFEGPADDDRQTVSVPRKNIRPYNGLSIQDQQNEEYIDRVKHVLKGKALVIEDVDTAYVEIESSAQVDWSQGSRLQFAEAATREV